MSFGLEFVYLQKIAEKVSGDSFVRGITGSGFAENPVRFNTL